MDNFFNSEDRCRHIPEKMEFFSKPYPYLNEYIYDLPSEELHEKMHLYEFTKEELSTIVFLAILISESFSQENIMEPPVDEFGVPYYEILKNVKFKNMQGNPVKIHVIRINKFNKYFNFKWIENLDIILNFNNLEGIRENIKLATEEPTIKFNGTSSIKYTIMECFKQNCLDYPALVGSLKHEFKHLFETLKNHINGTNPDLDYRNHNLSKKLHIDFFEYLPTEEIIIDENNNAKSSEAVKNSLVDLMYYMNSFEQNAKLENFFDEITIVLRNWPVQETQNRIDNKNWISILLNSKTYSEFYNLRAFARAVKKSSIDESTFINFISKMSKIYEVKFNTLDDYLDYCLDRLDIFFKKADKIFFAYYSHLKTNQEKLLEKIKAIRNERL